MHEVRPSRIFLIGFMGTGKSTVGQEVAASLGWDFCDTDALVEQKAGMPIPLIFAKAGEAAFRLLERDVLATLAQKEHLVVATGGGIVLDPRNVVWMRKQGLVICLNASPEVIWARVGGDSSQEKRPLLAGGYSTLTKLLSERTPLYQEAAHLQIDTTSMGVPQVVHAVIREYQKRRHQDG